MPPLANHNTNFLRVKLIFALVRAPVRSEWVGCVINVMVNNWNSMVILVLKKCLAGFLSGLYRRLCTEDTREISVLYDRTGEDTGANGVGGLSCQCLG
jgi:hypothetical protein